MKCVREHISCVRTLTLVERLLKAGYRDENGNRIKSVIGIPQGSILSPLLSNIVLHKLDKFMEDKNDELNVGIKRKINPAYMRLENQRKYYKTRNPQIARKALIEMRTIPKFDMFDKSFRRAIYIRYADDFIVLMAASLEQVRRLKEEIAEFL